MRYLDISGKKRFGLPLVAAGLVLGAGSGCSPDPITCAGGHGDFAVTLKLTSGTGECSELQGGIYGVMTYFPPRADGRPDLSKASVAIKSEDLGYLVDEYWAELGEEPDPANKPYAIGAFSSSAPKADLCEMPTLASAKQVFPTLPAIPATPDDPQTEEDESDPGRPAIPGFTVEYGWSNVKFIVSPEIIGTVFKGTMTYKVDDCTATYEAVGLYPAVFCDDGEGNPMDALCAPEANAELGIPLGSGINPDFKSIVKCHPDLLLCVFEDGKLPDALK